MFIKMVRDKDNLKKGRCYNVAEPKAIALLTEGYCVRGKEKNTLPTLNNGSDTKEDTSTAKRKK